MSSSPERPDVARSGRTSRDLALALFAALVLVAANDAYVILRKGFLYPAEELTPQAKAAHVGDHFRYIAMAAPPERAAMDRFAHEPPFCYRVLTPWIVRGLGEAGVSVDAAFYALTQVFLVLFLATLFLYLRARGFDRRYALLGTVLAGLLQGAVRWYAFQYWMTDPAALFLLTLGFLLIHRRKLVALGATSTVAVLNRETHLALFPYLFLRLVRREGLARAAARTAVLAIAPVAVFLVIRASVDAVPAPGLLADFRAVAQWRWEHLLDFQLYLMTIGSFGALFPLLFLFPLRIGRCVRARYPEIAVILLAYATAMVANNTDRLLVYALPAVLPLALGNLRAWVRVARVPFAAIAAAAVVVQLVLWLETDYSKSVLQPFSAPVSWAAGLFWVLAVGALLGRRGRAPPSELRGRR